jgi:glycosyltransferase involved in cell wall biosynthesis
MTSNRNLRTNRPSYRRPATTQNWQKNHTYAVSLICTVLNERDTIDVLLDSIWQQSYPPNEIVIVDGGSNDETWEYLQHVAQQSIPVPLRVFQAVGNRSFGRNEAIRNARHPLIAITDAGCKLDPEWLKELVYQYHFSRRPVISGYYASDARTAFEAAVVPYVLVMPNELVGSDFLPSTRSLLLEKVIWKQLGGFPEEYSDNEDYVFARRLRAANIPRSFARKAIVYWRPVSTFRSFYAMMFRFARGDAEARLFRWGVVGVFGRYGFGLLFLSIAVARGFWWLLPVFPLGYMLYLFWPILKHSPHVPILGLLYTPILQILADVAVMNGSIVGWRRG